MNAPTTNDPVELAMEAVADTPDVARSLLAKQERLIDAELLQRRGLLAAFALAAIVVLGGAGGMLWSASRADGLVIDAFSVPADLAQAGATGEAVASRLRDRLAAMNAETISAVASAALRENSAADVKVEFAGAGVSLGEVNRLLRDALGHETHVRGEVQRVTSGPEQGALALSVRVTGRPGERLVQADGDLDALIGRAAEQVFAARSPIRFVGWLQQKGRFEDTRAYLNDLAQNGATRTERALAYFGLSIPALAPSGEARMAILRTAYRLDPKLHPVLTELGALEFGLGHLETAFDLWRQGASAKAPPGSTPQGARFSQGIQEMNLGRVTGDYAPGLALSCMSYDLTACTEAQLLQAGLQGPAVSRWDVSRVDRLPPGVSMMAFRHATGAARQVLAGHPEVTQSWFYARANTARLSEDWTGLVAAVEAYEAVKAKGLVPDVPNDSAVWLPLALAKLGRLDEAAALAASKPADCQPCVRVRALVAAERRDVAASDRLFAEAVRLSPSTPFAEEEWARSLLARGQADAAIAKAEAAVRKGPKYADAHEVWGEALLAKGDAKAAAAKLATSARLTPRWGRAHLKWGQALAKQGKVDEARAKYRLAATMDLTAVERAELAQVLPLRGSSRSETGPSGTAAAPSPSARRAAGAPPEGEHLS